MARRRTRTPIPMPTLASALEKLRVPELRELAGLVLDSAPRRKAELVEAISDEVTAPDRLEVLVGRLSETERTALAEAVHEGGGEFDPDRFRAKYGVEVEPERHRGLERDRAPSLLRLFLHQMDWDDPRRVPDELLEPLRALLPEPEAPALRSTEELPESYPRPTEEYDRATGKSTIVHESEPFVVRETEIAARHDVRAVLALADAGRIAVTKKKAHPTAAAVRAVEEVLLEGDFYPDGSGGDGSSATRDPDELPGAISAFAWPLLLQAGGLARPWGGKLKLTKEGRRAMNAPPEEVLSRLWSTWSSTRLLDEFSRVEAIRGQSGRGRRGLTPPPERRVAVAGALAECPPGRWVEVEELWRFMRADGHDFQVSRDLWELYIAEKRYGALGYEGFGTWEVVQGRFVLALLFEYAATLGLVDVAYVEPALARDDFHHIWGTDDLYFLSRYDGLVWIRLTPLGAWVLGLADAPRPPEPSGSGGAFRALPNLEVVALEGARVSPAHRLVLDRFAESVGERVWRLDRTRLLDALEEGHSLDALRGLLAPADGGEGALPETVEAFFRDAEERATKLHDLGAARLVDCGDEALAALLSADPAIARSSMRAGAHHLVVPADREEPFRKALRRLGYPLPRSS